MTTPAREVRALRARVAMLERLVASSDTAAVLLRDRDRLAREVTSLGIALDRLQRQLDDAMGYTPEEQADLAAGVDWRERARPALSRARSMQGSRGEPGPVTP